MLKVISVFYAIAGIIASIVLGSKLNTSWYVVVGIVGTLISAMVIYAIGQIREDTNEILEILQKKTSSKKKSNVKEYDEDQFYICQSCKKTTSSNPCSHCGSFTDFDS